MRVIPHDGARTVPLSGLSAFLSAAAYAIYLWTIWHSGATPQLATWLAWTLLTSLLAITFLKASKDIRASAQYIAEALGCILVCTVAAIAGKFTLLDRMDWTIIVLCIIACAVWFMGRKAIWANVILAGTLVLGSLPTIIALLAHVTVEYPLPWWVWTAAFITTLVNVYQRADKNRPGWQLLLIAPVVGVAIHGTIAVIASLH
jgi:hypothetical protein